MKLIKPEQPSYSLKRLLTDHRLSWQAKGVYAQLLALPNRKSLDLIELSTHARNGYSELKGILKELQSKHYLIINNKLLIIKSLNKKDRPIVNQRTEDQVIVQHENQITNQFLRNQWLIVWHHDDAEVTQALAKLAKYLNPAMVLYGIQVSKRHCHRYQESLPYLNRLVMKWKKNRLTSVGQTQRWMNQRKLKSKPWNSEIQSRIFGSRRRTTINNTPLRKGVPKAFKKAFKKHHK